ncbi:MAG: Na/Pi cotransporter family protein [Limnochordales bacterium]|nr:Na/Pi cotransporter family protein [Limnochordales bacterium]
MWPDLQPSAHWWQGLPLPLAFLWGLAVFLLGVRLLARSLESVAGGTAERMLKQLAATPARAFALGAIVSALLHSSGITAASSIALVHAGIFSESQGFAVILGANIGTTFTAQLATLSWSGLIGPLILTGTLLFFLGAFRCNPRLWGAGGALEGLGGLFWGIEAMSVVAAAWAAQPEAVAVVRRFSGSPWASAGLGMVVAAALQSSTATVGLAMVAYARGLLPLPAAVAVVLGANVGTSCQGLLTSVGTQVSSRRAAVADFLFNLFGVLVVLPWLGVLTPWLLRWAGSPERQVANAHTFFNVFTATIALRFRHHLLGAAAWLTGGGEDGRAARKCPVGRKLVAGSE